MNTVLWHSGVIDSHWLRELHLAQPQVRGDRRPAPPSRSKHQNTRTISPLGLDTFDIRLFRRTVLRASSRIVLTTFEHRHEPLPLPGASSSVRLSPSSYTHDPRRFPMLLRRHGFNAQKRGGDDPPPWVTTGGSPMATTTTTLIGDPRPTGDDDEYTQYGPSPPTMAWSPTMGVPPPVVSQYLLSSTLSTSVIVGSVPQLPSATTEPLAIVPAQYTAAETPSAYGGGPTAGPTAEIKGKQTSNRAPMYAAAGAVPVIVIAIIGFVVFFCMRKRRKQRQQAATQIHAEKKDQQPTMHEYRAPAIPISRAPSYTSQAQDMQRLPSPPPVILGPISACSNSNYMTGIDTSEVMSTRTARTGLGDPFADGSSLHEEPPPPYQSRSLASRKSSHRMPRSSMSVSSQQSRHFSRPLRNPFEDPQEEDAVSDLSGATLHRGSDSMSAVSDMPYQLDVQNGRRST